jgi:hypothetical protein
LKGTILNTLPTSSISLPNTFSGPKNALYSTLRQHGATHARGLGCVRLLADQKLLATMDMQVVAVGCCASKLDSCFLTDGWRAGLHYSACCHIMAGQSCLLTTTAHCPHMLQDLLPRTFTRCGEGGGIPAGLHRCNHATQYAVCCSPDKPQAEELEPFEPDVTRLPLPKKLPEGSRGLGYYAWHIGRVSLQTCTHAWVRAA